LNPELSRQEYSRTLGDVLSRPRVPVVALVGGLVTALWLLLPAPSVEAAPPATTATALTGTFRLAPGSCAGGASGSYFRMILPTGGQQGPWIENADSTCADTTYTLLSPGTDGGLVTGSLQPAPSPGFDGTGNSLATRIVKPVKFFGVRFAASTNAKDLQTGAALPAPTVSVEGGRLSADLSSFDATWNKQAFNQGSPKPDGSRPGNTTAATGTYDAGTGRFTLSWTSQIVGGPFNNFTGQWHLTGTFVPAGASGASTGGGAAAGSGGSPGATTATTAAVGATGDTTATTQAAAATDERATGSPSGSSTAQASAAGAPRVRVEDDGFQAPTWLVILLAVVGIAGVVALLVVSQRSDPKEVAP
jgi:hypothetical protein